MLTFWLLAGLMLLVALALVLRPILKPPGATGVTSFDASVAIHRQRLKSLEQQHAEGTLGSEDFRQARQELELTLLEETLDQDPEATPPAPKPAKFTATVVLILVSALSLGLYVWLGNLRVLELLEDPAAMQALRDQHPPLRADVQRRVKNLQRRVRQVPGDIKAWDSLANGQMALEQYADAAGTFNLLIQMNGETPDRLANYAEATAIANQMQFSLLARQRLERALELAPGHSKSLMLGGMAAIQAGDKKLALARWKTLLPMHPPNSEPARIISMLINRTEQTPEPTSTNPTVADPVAPASTQINVELSLSPSLQEKITGNERVFVFARAAGGPPMPIAVKVLTAAELPTSVILDDNSAMPSARRLSSVEQVLIGARISFSGNATPTAGDLEGKSAPLRARDNPTLKLVIDSVRP